MKIPFQNLGQQPKNVELTYKEEGCDVKLEGEIKKTSLDSAVLKGKLTGTIELECDACAEPFAYHIDETIALTLTDRPYQAGEANRDEQDYDIIEFLDGMIDLNEIIESEVNTIRYDYHKCENCN